MNGANLILQVRTYLRDIDYSSVTTATTRGMFWSDAEILHYLNIAQYVFIRYCIEHSLLYHLTDLTVAQAITASTTLNTNYLHPLSANVVKNGITVPAKLYLGAEGIPYLNSDVDGCFIVGNTVVIMTSRGSATGSLWYIQTPTTITNSIFNDNFSEHIYDLFVNYASMLLGMKEVQTGREYKTKKRLTEELVYQPKVFANYLNDKEFVDGYKPQVQQRPN